MRALKTLGWDDLDTARLNFIDSDNEKEVVIKINQKQYTRVELYPTILGTSLILQNLHSQKNLVRQSPNRSDDIAVFDSDDSSTISNRVAG